MRENLFKAKRVDNGEWIEGSLIDLDIDSGYCYIVPPYKKASILPIIFLITDRMKLVDPETICQFTGLCDKNGKKIWEGDIISYQRDNDDCPFPNKDTKKRFGKVFYQGFRLTFAIGMGRNGSRSINDDLWKYVQNGNRVEAIGNRFDNPELLQEESDE
jgi:uncharacterized phage protein (TIGR01671 family)